MWLQRVGLNPLENNMRGERNCWFLDSSDRNETVQGRKKSTVQSEGSRTCTSLRLYSKSISQGTCVLSGKLSVSNHPLSWGYLQIFCEIYTGYFFYVNSQGRLSWRIQWDSLLTRTGYSSRIIQTTTKQTNTKQTSAFLFVWVTLCLQQIGEGLVRLQPWR